MPKFKPGHTPYWLQALMLLAFMLVGVAIFSLLSVGVASVLFGVKDMNAFRDILSNHPEDLLTSTPYLKTVLMMQLFNSIGFFGIPALLFAVIYGRGEDYLHLKGNPSIWVYIAGIITIISITPFIAWAGELNQRLWLPHFLKGVENLMQQSENAADKLTQIITQMHTVKDLVINIIIIGVAAGICEELLFRGCVQNILLRATHKQHVAVWVTAIIFSAIHMQFYGFVPRMVLGAMLGYMYVWNGSIWVNIIMHAFNNSAQVVLLYLFQHKLIAYDVDTAKAPSVYAAMVSAIITLSIMLYVRQKANPSSVITNP